MTNVVSDGLALSFLTFFSGTVDQFHLPQVTLATAFCDEQHNCYPSL